MSKKDEKTDEIIGDTNGAARSLSAKQEIALKALITHSTHKEAARAAGISETTLWRYKRDEVFCKRLREAGRGAVDHAAFSLQNASGDAVLVLRDMMMKENAPAAARISAARTVIDYSFRAAELDVLKSRVEQLEEFVRAKQEDEVLDSALKREAGDKW